MSMVRARKTNQGTKASVTLAACQFEADGFNLEVTHVFAAAQLTTFGKAVAVKLCEQLARKSRPQVQAVYILAHQVF